MLKVEVNGLVKRVKNSIVKDFQDNYKRAQQGLSVADRSNDDPTYEGAMQSQTMPTRLQSMNLTKTEAPCREGSR